MWPGSPHPSLARVGRSWCTRHRSPRDSAPRSAHSSPRTASVNCAPRCSASRAGTYRIRRRCSRTNTCRASIGFSRPFRRHWSTSVAEITFDLPDLGEGLQEATVLEWLVEAGDFVERNAPLVEVETTKSAVELPSPQSGTIARFHVQEG